MISPGLVSITFRKLRPEEIVDLVLQAKLEGIEWGGDVHVPHGNLAKARQVSRMTKDAGLAIAAYGSYYRLDNEKDVPFTQVLETAVNLDASLIRVWAGSKPSADSDDRYRKEIILQSQKIADMAAGANISVAYEFHRGTLTDTNSSALELLEEVNHPNMRIYWQPPLGVSTEYCLEGLRSVLPKLAHIHVFNWSMDGSEHVERKSLAEASDPWTRYIAEVKQAGLNCFAMLEFVKDDQPENLIKDSQALRSWLANGSD